MGIKVSVIVPVYNVENFIEKCILSLKSQTLREIEFIIVDDGSTDNSYVIAEKIINGDKRFIHIKQENSGAGAARNYGISFATGDFIGFVDSDDYVTSDYYQKMYECALLFDSDMVILGNVITTSGSIISLSYPGSSFSVEELSKISFNCIDYPYILENVFLWNRIFKRQLWLDNKLLIPENRKFAEDLLICTQMTVIAKKISCVDKPCYVYRDDVSNSLSKKLFSSNKKTDFIRAVHETLAYVNNVPYSAIIRRDIVIFMTHIFIMQLKSKFSKKEFYQFFFDYLGQLSNIELEIIYDSWLNERYPEVITSFKIRNPSKCYRKNKICRILHI